MLTEDEAETGDDASDRLEDRLRRLEEGMVDMRLRLARLEAAPPPPPEERPAPAPGAAEQPAPAQRSDLSLVLSLAGRSFMVLGGAFLLRALTESGRVPRGIGIACGIVYALVWLVGALRARGDEHRLGATFHGVTAVVIGFPLLWEASTRFALLAPPASAGGVALLTSAALAVAWRRELWALAAATVLSCVALALALLASSQQPIPFTLLLVAVGTATVWLGEARGWPWLGWLPALVADAAVASLTVRTLQAEALSPFGAVVGTQLFLGAAYVGSFVGLALLRRRSVNPFEVLQSVAALAIGLIGAVLVTHSRGGEAVIGAASLVVALAAYGGAILSRRGGRRAAVNFHFYALLALLLTFTGSLALERGPGLAVGMAVIMVVAAWLAHRLEALDFALHAAVFGAVAAGASGFLGLIGAAFVAAPTADWPALNLAMWLTLAATIAAVVIPRPAAPHVPPEVGGVPEAFLALLVVLEVSAAVIAFSAPAIAGVPADAGTLATLRTAVLAAIAVLLAVARRRRRTEVLGWLVYPLLCAIAIKLALEDLRHSEPATMFVALGIFGVALLATARLVRRSSDGGGAGADVP